MSYPGEDLLERIVRKGHLTIVRADGTQRCFGDGSGDEIVVRFHDDKAQADLARNPEMATGELYADGRYTVDKGDIYDLLALVIGNGAWDALPPRVVARPLLGMMSDRLRDKVTGDRARANVAHHYDLDAGLFDLFLDPHKQYSCAYFPDGNEDLETAQVKKMRHIAAKLMVRPGHSVLDIGCGWGGLAIYLAKVCGATVTGVTLSENQAAEARQRVAAAGVADRVTIELTDYRDVTRTFDRVVSVGMFEHVGTKNYPTYFKAVHDRLAYDHGVALIHSIGDRKPGIPTSPWIARYIFPGGYIPAVSEVVPPAEAADLLVKDLEILPIHYARTLRLWRERFMARRDEAAAIYDERFVRLWEFYLAASETAFRYDWMFVFQIQLARHLDAVPFQRDYIAAEEKRLAKEEKRAGYLVSNAGQPDRAPDADPHRRTA